MDIYNENINTQDPLLFIYLIISLLIFIFFS